MKRNIILSLLFAGILVFFTGCRKKAGPLACASSTVQYSEDLSAYLSNQTKSNCERVAKSIKDLYQSCGALSAVDREAYEEIEEDLDCGSL